MPYAPPLMKYKLRQLRKLEQTLRFNGKPVDPARNLVWDVFFSTKPGDKNVKYPLLRLVAMSEAEYKSVIEEFFFRIYFQSYKENGLALGDVYEPQLLDLLGLPPYAGLAEVKKRFRELAMRYHPDRGGDADKFIELMDTYTQITAGKKDHE
jgi:DnaJ domain